MSTNPVDLDPSERALGVGLLVWQVQRMVEASGQADGFDAAGWVARWLAQPLPALAGFGDGLDGVGFVAQPRQG